MISYSSLLNDKKIRHEPAARGQVSMQLAAARRDLETARKLGSDDEWAYSIAYNAMLLAGRAVMFSEEYRPTAGEGGHAAVVEFLRIRLDPSFAPMLAVMDRMRRQRHRIAYDAVGSVSKKQITEAIGTAEEFVTVVESLLTSSSTPFRPSSNARE